MEKLLAYRKTTLWLLVVYLPILVVPWVLICVLDVRPLNAPSYNDQRGNKPPSTMLTILIDVLVVRVLNSIGGVLVVPVVGAIIAQAAVVFTQRRSPKQQLNLVQLFALADRGWVSIWTLWKARATGASSSFLWAAALMTMISSLQQPIQSALVSFEAITVMSCVDLPSSGSCNPGFPVIAAYDAEPGAISLLPHNLVVADLASSIVAMSDLDQQPNLWVDNPYSLVDQSVDAFVTQPNRGMFLWYAPDGPHFKDTYFVSALRNGTTTGVLRQHAIRMNSSASCEPIPRTSFPASCGGARPVEASFSNEVMAVRVCVPGEIGTSPWTLSRNRQDISEEMYIDAGFSTGLNSVHNFTTKCTAGSARGYFELGNQFNGFAYGPLIQDWPEPEVIENEFNDYLSTLNDLRPTVEDLPSSKDISSNLVGETVVDPFGTSGFNASAPLITAASALFGNNSFLNILDPQNNLTSAQILTLMCTHGNIPFSLPIHIATSPDFTGYCFNSQIAFNTQNAEEADSAVATVIGLWLFNRFNSPADAEYILGMSMYFANRAVLNKAVMIAQPFDLRPIYTSPGILLFKPSKTLTATIVVSLLIAMQVVGLGILAGYIYSRPTWTSSLDALAIARIGREVPEGGMPPLGPVTEEDLKKMREVDALIGVQDADASTYPKWVGTDVESIKNQVELTLGGRGVVRGRLM